MKTVELIFATAVAGIVLMSNSSHGIAQQVKLTIKVDRPTLSPADIQKLEGEQAEALDGKPLKHVQPGPQ